MSPRLFPARLEELASLRRYISEMAQQAGLSKDSDYRLRLAVDEIATNIITHGYQDAGCDGVLAVSAEIDSSELRIVLEDTGAPFDPGSRPMPTEEELQQPLEERNIGGLGIYLVAQGIDRFEYQRAGEMNRNILVMRLKK